MIRRIVLSAALIVFIPLVIFLAVNSWDEDIDPKALAIVTQEAVTTPQGEAAFFYLLGLRVADSADPEAEGRRIWAESRKLPVKERNAYFDTWMHRRHGLWPSLRARPREKDTSVAQYWKQNKEDGPDDFEAFALPIKQYIRLIEYGDYTQPPNEELLSRTDTPIQELLKGHRLLVLHFGELASQKKFAEIERLIRAENEFYRGFLAGRGYLLGTMIAHIAREENASILEAELKTNPKFKVSPATLASFRTPSAKEMSERAMESELRFVGRLVRDAGDGGSIMLFTDWVPTDSIFSLDRLKTRFLVKPNATINRYYTQMHVDHPEVGVNWWAYEPFYTWPRNPGGKFITAITRVQIQGRLKKLAIRSKQLEETLARLDQG